MKRATDFMSILQKVKASESDAQTSKITIAVLCDATFQPLDVVTNHFLEAFGLKGDFLVGNFGQVAEEAIFSDLTTPSNPEFIFFHSSSLGLILRAVDETGKGTDLKSLCEKHLELIRALVRRYPNQKIIVNTLELPPFRQRGTLSTRNGAVRQINNANTELVSIAEKHHNLLLHDVNYVSARCGLDRWYDLNAWAAFRQPYSHQGLVQCGSSLASVIASAMGKSMKLLVSDLDNTLWGGVIGDDGADGLLLGTSSPKGELFAAIQSYLSSLKKSGIILAINSKNELSNIGAGFELDAAALSLSDFAAVRANWQPKSGNFRDILAELNLSENSAVFIDDSPSEIMDVETSLPGVTAISYAKSPIEILQQIERLGLFETQRLTSEDTERSSYYEDNTKRADLQTQFDSHDDFLRSLKMRSKISWKAGKSLERVSSLSLKTNQFNLTQRGLTTTEVTAYESASDKWVCLADLNDVFGPNGVVSFAFGYIDGRSFVIENWVMSCRVFNRSLDSAMMAAFSKMAVEHGCLEIQASLNIIEKNKFCHDLFDNMAFTCSASDGTYRKYSRLITAVNDCSAGLIEVDYG